MIVFNLAYQLYICSQIFVLANKTIQPLLAPDVFDQMDDTVMYVFQMVPNALEADKVILFSKLDITDRYWKMTVQAGIEWNLSYVLLCNPKDLDI